jgi:hypothetical protein
VSTPGNFPAALANLQYELVNPPNDSGFRFGRETNIHVAVAEFGDPDMRINDEVNPFGDGIRMGRDYYAGRTITFDINITKKYPDARSTHQVLAEMMRAWTTADVVGAPSRLTSGNISLLRMYRHGVHKVVFGRPRRFTPVTGNVDLNWVPITCDFQTIDHLFYEENERSTNIQIVPPTVGGFVFPIEFPWSTVPITSQADVVQINGDAESWLTFTITGPIVNPTIEFVDYYSIKCNITLLPGETLVIDPRPWSRGVYKNGSQNVSGCFTADSRRLSGMTAPPGNHQIVLRGTDGTGTARLETRWRDTYTSW